MTTQNADEFRTSDLYFAAYLLVAGLQLMRPERMSTGKITFVFDSSISNVEELKLAWFSQTGKVPAMQYANAVKSLKSVCHMP